MAFCFIMRLAFILLITCWFSNLFILSEETPEQDQKANLVKQIGASTFQVGLIEFDAKTKIISLPAEVWNTEGLMEYVLVHDNGKIHESILTTKISPTHLQVAMKLLKFTAGKGELFERIRNSSDRTVKVDNTEKVGSSFEVKVNWKEEGELKTASICQLILNPETMQPIKECIWKYTGSVVYKGQFLAELEGSIIGLYLDPAALFNTNAPRSDSDEHWGANKAALPKSGTKVVVTLVPVVIAAEKEANE